MSRPSLLKAAFFWYYIAMQKDIVKILKSGGIGVYPTDTLYGIVSSALSRTAVERIYRLKGRDENKPFIILISDIKDLRMFGVSVTKEQQKILDSLWPGPVSIIFQTTKMPYLHRGQNSLAFRMPKSKKVLGFLKKTGPLVAPSANPQGLQPAQTIADAKRYFSHDVDFYVAGGRKQGKASRVVRLEKNGTIVVLRK